MGIQGLLPNFKSITRSTHVSEYAGKKVAVDTYSWLHKGALSCAKDLCQGRSTDKYLEYCMHRVRLLQNSKVIPLLVFDGGPLPGKLEEEDRREVSRKENRNKALAHERAGNSSAAYECWQKAVDITPAHAHRLIKVLQAQKIEYIVAPYEADAQLAFLALNGHVDAVITEDSDLLAHGCPKVLYKMDKFGNGMEIRYCDLPKTKELCFVNFTQQMVLEMCIFSGCDYLPSLSGMGVKRAHALIKRMKNFRKAIKWLKFQGTDIPADYKEAFHRAVLTFKHQRVFDPVSQEIVHLNEVPQSSDIPENLDFVGPPIDAQNAYAIATGLICPVTLKPFQETLSPPRPLKNGTGKRRRSADKVDNFSELDKITRYLTVKKSTSAKKPFKVPRTVAAPISLPARVDLYQPDSEQASIREAEDAIGSWNSLPSASLPDSDELDLNPQRYDRDQALDLERRPALDDLQFNVEKRTAPIDDMDLDLDNPFETFRLTARKGSSSEPPGDSFELRATSSWADRDTAREGDKRILQSTFKSQADLFEPLQRRVENSDLLRPQQERVESRKEVNERPLDFISSFQKRKALEARAVQPGHLLDLNRNVVADQGDVRKRSNYFQSPVSSPAKEPNEAFERSARSDAASRESDNELRIGGKILPQEHCTKEKNNPHQQSNKSSMDLLLQGRRRHMPSLAGPQLDAERERPDSSSGLDHLEAYSSTAKKAIDGIVSKLQTFKYVPSSSRQSVLRNLPGKRVPIIFPR